MKRHPGWTFVQRLIASDFALAGFVTGDQKLRGGPLRVHQFCTRYLNRGEFSPSEIKTFLPEIVRIWSIFNRRNNLPPPPALPISLRRKTNGKG